MTVNEINIGNQIGMIENDLMVASDYMSRWSQEEQGNVRIMDGEDSRELSRRLIKEEGGRQREVSVRIRWGRGTNKAEKELAILDTTNGGMNILLSSNAGYALPDSDIIEAVLATLNYNESVMLVRMEDDELLDLLFFIRRQLKEVKRMLP